MTGLTDTGEITDVPDSSAPTGPAAATTGLDWATRLLFGADPESVRATVRSRGERPPPGWVTAESYLAVPRASNPRLLVPLGSAKAAAAALARNHDATSTKARLGKQALAAGLLVGVAQRLLPDRVDVSVRTAGDRDALLSREVERIFDRRPLHLAVLLGPPRLNRKPVLCVLSPEGEVVGYVKAAWNDLTRGLVDNEARALRQLSGQAGVPFTAPQLVHHGPWGSLTLLATTALPNTVRPEASQVFDPPMDVIAAIAGTVPVTAAALAGSDYWAGVRERLARRPSVTPGTDLLAAVVDHIEARDGGTEMRFGAWHGDFTPWNMARTPDGIYIWDWERAGPGPVGLDLVHFLFQSVCRFDGRKPSESVEICRERTPELLKSLDVLSVAGSDDAVSYQEAQSEEALWNVYRMELLFRYDEASRSGVLAGPSRIHSGILEMFEREMER